MGLIGPWQNAAEGAAAALCALVAMATVSVLALALLGASSFGSLWRLTMTVTAMAVGGPVTVGPDPSADSGSTDALTSMFGGGGMGASMTGAAHVVPLGVTMTGAVVLWLAFSRRLRQGRQRRFTGGEVAVRTAGAAAAAMVTFMIVAGLGHGSATLPEGAMSGMRPGEDQSAEGMGGLMGGGGAGAQSMAYEVNAGLAGLGALLWVAVVIGTGCLISRRGRLPLGGALDKLRTDWGRSLSAVVRAVLVLAALPTVTVAFVGAVVGGRAGSAAGAALLVAPNALVVFLTLGVGSSWTAAMHQVQSDGSNPMAALMGGMADTGGMGDTQQPDRVEHLRSLSVAGWPLWLVALTVTGLILVACACRAARTTHSRRKRPMLPYRGPLAGHFVMAERLGVVTAVVLGLATWEVGASGNFGISMFGSEMGGMRAELSGSVLTTVGFGLLIGAAAGFAGSLLSVVRGGRLVGSVAGFTGALLSTVRGRGVR
ncbi:streptophobe family protein [Streptomyces hokutonensis]|uniref:streptophobe family protein n=1 Tax=Streptomyces hokutonensis TaxID=1306990 RepID=UPI00248123F4|nr:streptophobe family protein [Streptomyces hokutonensis]